MHRLTLPVLLREAPFGEVHVHCDVEGASLLVVLVVGHSLSRLLYPSPRPRHLVPLDADLVAIQVCDVCGEAHQSISQ